ncbi:acyltransferase family protein [Neotabrizicola shimadae]|uniref:Acyltransferase n=1 Tax=Neotabrizicola shimadae TaxID=2807096 RepID=A0A8G1EDB2_9RHOB|nr:acyltransferase family protein [Neotabrizicola shimadae]QYZ69224.1 acyltransferase [Neotabrizicola shimadae]
MTLGEAMASGRGNNLHALRLALAAAVVISHAWPLARGAGTDEPLEALTGHSLGGWAVGLFFFLSGLLISGSAARQPSGAFWAARARRLLPGLAVALIVTLALAVATGGRPAPAQSAEYLLRGITLVSLEHQIPGAFARAPMPGIVNGPLWSLSHEIAAYALCWAAARLGLMRHIAGIATLGLAALALWLMPGLGGRAAVFAPLFLAFALGMLAQALRDRLPLSWPLAAGLMLLAPLGWPFALAALGCLALMLAFWLPARPLSRDLSYGVYIYGWPVGQTLIHLVPGLSPAALAVATLAGVLPFAWASWTFVESPALPRRAVA